MRYALLLLLLLSFVSAKMYVIEFSYADGALTADQVYVAEGIAPDHRLQPATGYALKTFAGEEELDAFRFALPDIVLHDSFDTASPGGAQKLDEIGFATSSKYFADADEIRVFDSTGALSLTIDVSRFKESELKAAFKTEESGIGNLLPIVMAVFVVVILGGAYKKYGSRGEKKAAPTDTVSSNWQDQMFKR